MKTTVDTGSISVPAEQVNTRCIGMQVYMYVLNFLLDLSTLAQLQTEAEREFSKVL